MVEQRSEGRVAAERVAAQLLGGPSFYAGWHKPSPEEPGTPPLLGVAVYGPVILLTWSGMPSSSLRWDRLDRDPACQRFALAVFPASNGLEVSWESASGEVLRHVSICDGEMNVDEGDERLVDENADDDPSIDVLWENRPQDGCRPAPGRCGSRSADDV